MSRYYRRVRPERKNLIKAGLLAGGLATVVGAMSFYLARILLDREALESLTLEPADRDEKARDPDKG